MEYKSMKERITEERARGEDTRVRILFLDSCACLAALNCRIDTCLLNGVELKNLEFIPEGPLRLITEKNQNLHLLSEKYIRSTHWELYHSNPSHFDSYHSNPALEIVIREVTSKGIIDYVIIGNNEGGGIDKARAVDESLRAEKACVVWHEYNPGDEIPYQNLGYTKFLSRDNCLSRDYSRDDLSKHLTQLFRKE